MSYNAKQAIVFSLFAVGLIFLIVGWTTSVYDFWLGVIVFHGFLFSSIILRKAWRLKRSLLFGNIPLGRIRGLREEKS